LVRWAPLREAKDYVYLTGFIAVSALRGNVPGMGGEGGDNSISNEKKAMTQRKPEREEAAAGSSDEQKRILEGHGQIQAEEGEGGKKKKKRGTAGKCFGKKWKSGGDTSPQKTCRSA